MKKLLSMLLITGLLLLMLSTGALALNEESALDGTTLDRNDATYQDIPTTFAATTYGGNFENCDSTLFKGWAWNSAEPNTPINVHVYVTNITTGISQGLAISANEYRYDLAVGGIGNGYHAFSYTIDWYDYVPGTYKVEAFAYNPNGNSPHLANSPRTFVVEPPTGNFEECSSSLLRGWAWKPQCPNKPIEVHVSLNNNTTGQTFWLYTAADAYRSDLVLNGIGNGSHAFSIPINWDTYPQGSYTVTAHAFVRHTESSVIGVKNYANGYVPPSFMWPTTSKQITSYYGWRELNFTQNLHRGIDIAPTQAGARDNVYCFSKGVIAAKIIDTGEGYGNALFVAHVNPRPATGASHVQTLYGHFSAFAGSPSVGSSVSMGQTLGYMGNTGNSFGVHLHFGTYSATSLALGRSPEGSAFNPLGNYFTDGGGIVAASTQEGAVQSSQPGTYDAQGRLIVNYYYQPDENAMGQ